MDRILIILKKENGRVKNTPLHPTFNVHPYTWVYKDVHFHLFFIQSVDCGYLLEMPCKKIKQMLNISFL